MNPLKTALASLSVEDANAKLRGIWAAFAGTQQHQALDLLLSNMEFEIDTRLLLPGTGPGERDFHAGRRAAVTALRTVILAVSDPASYAPDAPPPEAVPDEPPQDTTEEP
jgi:hypothetical protein